MDFKKFKTILDRVTEHPKIKELLDRQKDSATHPNRYVEILRKVLSPLLVGLAFFGGRTVRKIEAVLVAIGLLIELTILLKEKVIDDPEVRRLVQQAWDELKTQSLAAYTVAQQVVKKFRAKSSQEKF